MSEIARIAKMLDEGGAELQCAAAMVLGELGSPEAHGALLKALRSENETLRLYAVEALAKIDPKSAAPHLIPLMAAGSRLRARIQQVLASVGQEIVPLLQKQIDKAAPDVRAAILEVLGSFKSVDLSETLFDALKDRNPEVVRQAADALKARFAGLAAPERGKATKHLIAFLGKKLAPAAMAAGLRLLGELPDASSVKLVMRFLGKKEDPAVRLAALEALSRADPAREAERVVPAVLGLLDDDRLVSAGIALLNRAKVARDHVDRILELLGSGSAAVRLFAVQALGSMGGARAAAGLVQGIFSPDGRIAEEASNALRSNAAFAQTLIKALQGEEDSGKAWKIATILRSHREAVDGATQKQFLARLIRLHEKRSGAFKVYFEILRSVAPALLRETVVRRGWELMKRRKFDEAERLLQLVSGDDLATGESDFALATALLVTLKKDLATARMDRSQAVGVLSKLIRRGDHPVLKDLEKHAVLMGADSLLYLGFVLIERQGTEREFGASVLKLVTKKFGRRKEGETARAKLKTQGAG